MMLTRLLRLLIDLEAKDSSGNDARFSEIRDWEIRDQSALISNLKSPIS
jgi:hypothetical protein